MRRLDSRNLTFAALAAVFTFLVIAPARAGQTPTVDLTHRFVVAGAVIDDLQVVSVDGIVVIRGHTVDRTKAEDVGRIARKLGFRRVANLVQVVAPVDDAAIQRQAERQLAMSRSLDGCQFKVASLQGVVQVGGHVQSELQKDLVIELLRSVDGVRQVRSTLDVVIADH
jgi:osmotically-inducible protein OsmY